MKKQFTWKTSEELIKRLKIKAVEEDKNANEILDKALELYLKNQSED